MGMTAKQAATLEFIREFIADRGFAPTLEEIGSHFGIAGASARERVKALESLGLIRTVRNETRSISIVNQEQEESGRWPDLKILGRVAAGLPIEAVETPQAFDFDGLFPEDRDTFVLEVKGSSMIDDHIQDGDLVICERRQKAGNGEMIVALVDEESATLKYFYHEGDKIRLEPANKTMKSIIVDASRVRIQGSVIGVVRRY
jgi:repressor LexA